MNWVDLYVNLKFPVNRNLVNYKAGNTLKKKYIPKYLYQYQRFDKYSIENLKQEQAWYKIPCEFNDPYDTFFTYDKEVVREDILGKDMLNSLVLKSDELGIVFTEKEKSAFKELPYKDVKDYLVEKGFDFTVIDEQIKTALDRYKDKTDDRIKSRIKQLQRLLFVTCLSEINDSILMWSHYGGQHSGFCVEYKLRDTEFENYLEPVIYDYKIFNLTDLMLRDEKVINPLYVIYAAMRKNIDWEYEREWRIIKWNTLRLEEKGHLFAMPKPSAIYCGSKISKDNKKTILSIAKYKNLKVFQMEMDLKEFKLNSTREL
ncbi:MAG: DUF2971 domain-containing protein [Phascolarctobacterium sp.]|nr:DUF2971 domain-containing protein [Phascolarctobacterium sp.]